MKIFAAALNFSVYFSLSVVSCHLRWRWRCLEFLPPPWQGVWWSDGSVLTVSSLGFLWTNKNIMLSLKNRRHVFVDVIFHDVVPRGSGAITSLFSLHISSQKRLILENMFVVLTCLVSGLMRSKNARTVARTSSLHLGHKHTSSQ